ncbi:hypothetical protein NDU88_001587 [Pleurodeles waltl]|uniref:Uncharacterized protein n=1 Tax=Pleurodeles waltl TaxID=8319 RepID=A0AAV7UUR9_PLEWA|nr:hypothetical protein NDU88_001587 [Pleurodeles waltl]
MCHSTAQTSETRLFQAPGEAPGGRLRHWGRAALKLRRVRRGSARIPLRGNPGRVSTGKAPGKESQEPDSTTTRLSSPSPNIGKTSKVVGVAGARGTARFSTGKAPGKVSRELDSAGPNAAGSPGDEWTTNKKMQLARRKTPEWPPTLTPGKAVVSGNKLVLVTIEAKDIGSSGEARLMKGVYILDVDGKRKSDGG